MFSFRQRRRTESKRVFKTLLRSCLKQKPSDNIKNFYQPNKHARLFRSPSTPSLKRIWICHACGLENNSVTWHCLNCECVSYLAPIYKETLKKKTSLDADSRSSVSAASDKASIGGDVIKPADTSSAATSTIKTALIDATSAVPIKTRSSSMDTGDASNNLQQQKCHLCLYKTKPLAQLLVTGKEPICRHQNRSKNLRFPMIESSAKVGSEQKSFDDSKYYVHDGLYYSNRKINKSLSSITDSFVGGTEMVLQPNKSGAGIFGERVDCAGSRTVHENLRRTSCKGAGEYVQQQLAQPFGEFTTTAQQRKQIPTAKRTILCDVCGVCNQNRCARSSVDSSEPTSRFTITTLSRMGHHRGGTINQQASKMQTLPRNGGVFVAVRDWSIAVASESRSQAAVVSSPDTYYEILKNPNNNSPYENQEIINKTKESNLYENQPLQLSQEPIYAVVNKLNKTKNKLVTQQSEPKFTYVGMAAGGKFVGSSTQAQQKPLSEPESLYASIGAGGMGALNNNQHRLPSLDNDGDGEKSSQITITSSADHTGSDTSEIYAKVWKGPRKSLDSQKM